MKKTAHNLNSKNKGFTLLFSILVSTLVVSIGATIISIALRQTILSGTSRESQYAFYAANTALDCAHRWDIVGVQPDPAILTDTGIVFPADEDEIQTDNPASKGIRCSGVNIVLGPDDEEDDPLETDKDDWESVSGETTFYLEITNQVSIPGLIPYTYCAQATITKDTQSNDTVLTTIEARGYNTCDKTNPRRVERGLVQQYES